jgi:hypothetical protein
MYLESYALIISGEALLRVTSHEELKEQFLAIAEHCNVVLACRVSPK